MDQLVAVKTANALIPNADLASAARSWVTVIGGGAVEDVVEGFRSLMGGLWVGGKATLYTDRLSFQPNALNRALHDGDYSLEISLSDIEDVCVRWGVLTKIIDVETDAGRLSLRCFGAPAFAKQILLQRQGLSG